MLCENCHQPIVPSEDGIVVCGHCGRVNMAQSIKDGLFTDQAAAIEQANVTAPPAPPSRSFISKHLLLTASFAAFAVAGFLLTVLTQNISASHKLNSAVAADKAGNYQKAATLLKSYDSIFIASSTKNKAKTELTKNKKWQQDAVYQTQAETLLSEQKYQDALVVLSKIGSDYPTFKNITSLSQKAKASQAALDQQKALAAVAQQKKVVATQTQPVQKKTQTVAQQNTTQTAPVKLPDTQPSGPTYTASAIPPNVVYGGSYYYVGARQYASASGASVVMSQAQPSSPQTGAQNHSLMEMAVQSNDGQQIIEVGWTVDAGLNGDSAPHLFVFHWVNGVPTCYNVCGFTQVSLTNFPGETVSTNTTGSYQISFDSNHWNIYYNGDLVGYYDEAEWSGGYTQAGFIQVFGEVYIGSTSATQCIQMGNGIAGNSAGSAQIKNFSLIGSASGPNLSAYYTSPSTYSAGSIGPTGFNLGGPGSC